MKEVNYLFITTDGRNYEISSNISFKDALYKLAVEWEDNAELLWKCLNGFGESEQDKKDMIKVCDTFCSHTIDRVYTFEERIYDFYETEEKNSKLQKAIESF